MDPLKICSVEFDDRDPYRATFNVHLSRDMTDFERQALPPLLSSGFSPSEARGSAVVAIRNATITMIEDHRDLLKQIVAEAHKRHIRVIMDLVANHTAWDSVMMEHPEFYKQNAQGKVIPPVPEWTG